MKSKTEIANRIKERIGIDTPKGKKITKLNLERAQRIADAYQNQETNPNDPEVQASYEALIDETVSQYEAIIADGFGMEMSDTEYKSSTDMISDLRDNKNMRVFSTEEGFGSDGITDADRAANPMLAPTNFKDKNGKPLLVNDIFRFVHDFFGHSKEGNSFGPLGEENAWDVHSRMYTPLARKAMTTETRGQNSWVNFSGVNEAAFALRDEARALRKEGKFDEAEAKVKEAYATMQFADQKVMLLPEEFTQLDSEADAPQSRKQQESKEVYESNPKLGNIGTLQQYNEYLETIFPDSKVKNIVYHGGPKGITEFVDYKKFGRSGIYATGSKEIAESYGAGRQIQKYNEGKPYSEHIDMSGAASLIRKGKITKYGKTEPILVADFEAYPILVDITNPERTQNIVARTQEELDAYKKEGIDGLITKGNVRSQTNEILVMKPNQIHILGSNKDVKGFEDFAKNNSEAPQSRKQQEDSSVIEEQIAEIEGDLEDGQNELDSIRAETKAEVESIKKRISSIRKSPNWEGNKKEDIQELNDNITDVKEDARANISDVKEDMALLRLLRSLSLSLLRSLSLSLKQRQKYYRV